MIISLIAAVDKAGGIGKDGDLPWHLSDDLKNFKKLTMGHHMLMGRKTYASIAGKLKGRKLIVLSRDESFSSEEAIVARTLEEGLRVAEEAGEEELFVIGGEEIFEKALPKAEYLYLTRVDTISETDTKFPVINEKEWLQIGSAESFEANEKNEYSFTISKLAHVLIKEQ